MKPCTSTNLHEACNGDKLHFSMIDSMKACWEAGFRAIDLNFHTAGSANGPLASDLSWKDWLKEVIDVKNELGLEIPSCHSFFYLHEDRTEEREALTRRSIEASGIVGSRYVVLHPYSVCDETWYSHRKSIEENVEYLRRYADIARPYGLGLAIENMVEDASKRRFGSCPEDLMELIDVLDDPIFEICWDFGHGERSNCNTVEALRQMGDLLKVVHVHDWTANKVGFDHTIPFLGKTDWDAVMPTLKETGFNGYWNLECPNFTKNLPATTRSQALRLAYEVCCETIRKSGLPLEQ